MEQMEGLDPSETLEADVHLLRSIRHNGLVPVVG